MQKLLRTWAPGTDWIVQVKPGLHNARSVRVTLLDLAYIAQENPLQNIVGIFTAGRASSHSIMAEKQLFQGLVRHELAARLHLVKQIGPGVFTCLPDGLSPAWIASMINQWSAPAAETARRKASKQDVLPILLINWLGGNEPVTTHALCKAARLTYTTGVVVLKQLRANGVLLTDASRRVSLKMFPFDEWYRWVALRAETRRTYRFVSRSAKPPTPYDHMQRLQKQNLGNLAISGALGAHHHFPNLHLPSRQRLDLIAHAGGVPALDFIHTMDQSLVLTENLGEHAHVVVHSLQRDAAFFESSAGVVWADPFECMADLHEDRLHVEADEMLKILIARQQANDNAQAPLRALSEVPSF